MSCSAVFFYFEASPSSLRETWNSFFFSLYYFPLIFATLCQPIFLFLWKKVNNATLCKQHESVFHWKKLERWKRRIMKWTRERTRQQEIKVEWNGAQVYYLQCTYVYVCVCVFHGVIFVCTRRVRKPSIAKDKCHKHNKKITFCVCKQDIFERSWRIWKKNSKRKQWEVKQGKNPIRAAYENALWNTIFFPSIYLRSCKLL